MPTKYSFVRICRSLMIKSSILQSIPLQYVMKEPPLMTDGSLWVKSKTPGTNHNLISQFPDIKIKKKLHSQKCTKGKQFNTFHS